MADYQITLPDDIDLSEYDAQVHPGLLLEHMKHGYSIDSFGALCNVSQREVERWLKTSIPFRLAYEKGHSHGLFYWETKLLNGLEHDGKVNDKLLLYIGDKRFSDYGRRGNAIADTEGKAIDPILEMKRIIGK